MNIIAIMGSAWRLLAKMSPIKNLSRRWWWLRLSDYLGHKKQALICQIY